MKSATIQPIKDQPNNHEPARTRTQSSLERLFTTAKKAGMKTMHKNIAMIAIYFRINKISFKDIILYSVFCFLS